MKRITLLLISGLLLALAFAVPAFAGGWAVVTLDELPGRVAANQPLEVGFIVRQHGVTPMQGLRPVIHAEPSGFGKPLKFAAEAKGEPGHYIATITLPEAGEWKWSIAAFTVNQPMPTLIVLEGAPASVAEESAQAPTSVTVQNMQWLPALLGVASLLAGLVISLRRKVPWAIALTLAAIIYSAGGIVYAANQPKVEQAASSQGEAEAVSAETSISQVDLGHQLFIAKGCMVCHSHSETNNLREFGVDTGPNLTDFTASPDYLRLWLKDPLEAKSTAQMPQLELSETEIEALIAFINDK